MEKICENVECGVVFEAKNIRKLYCCQKCNNYHNNNREDVKARLRISQYTDHAKAVRLAYRQSEHGKVVKKAYSETDKAQTQVKEYRRTPEFRKRSRAYIKTQNGKLVRLTYRQTEKAKAIANQSVKEYKKRNPDKTKAQKAAQRAFPIRQQCSMVNCNSTGNRHHPDYKKPLEIIWLCVKHHNLQHRK